MEELSRDELSRIAPLVDETGGIAPHDAYISSVLDGPQDGRVFLFREGGAPAAAILWHRAGFGYTLGDPENREAGAHVRELLLERTAPGQPRFVLYPGNAAWEKAAARIFRPDDPVREVTRLAFTFDGLPPAPPTEEEIRPLDAALLTRLRGRFIPSFSFRDDRQFLSHGFGFCVLREGQIAASSFTAALGRETVDISLETDAACRGQGLGTLVARRVAEAILAGGRTPDWRCVAHNPASEAVAIRIGFRRIGSHRIFMLAH